MCFEEARRVKIILGVREAAESKACRKQHLISRIKLMCASAKTMKSSLGYQESVSEGPIKIVALLSYLSARTRQTLGFNMSQLWIISSRWLSKKGQDERKKKKCSGSQTGGSGRAVEKMMDRQKRGALSYSQISTQTALLWISSTIPLRKHTGMDIYSLSKVSQEC